MRPKSADDRAHRRATLLRQSLGYLGAFVLPSLFIIVSFRTRALHATPVALSMASIALITIATGFGPGLTAALWTTFFFNHKIADPGHLFAMGMHALNETAAVLVVGLLVTFFFERQHVIDRRLRVALASLQQQAAVLEEAQRASGSVVWTFNTADLRVSWAEGGSEIFGQPFSESMSQGPLQLVMEEDRAAVESIFAQALSAGHPFQLQFRCRWPDGEIHWLESRGTPSPGKKNIWRGVTTDITDRKNAEFALLRAEKLAAIGRLSATIAHEMNNPLEAVTNLLYLASADPLLSSETRTYLANADQELRRLSSIARHTLTFARPRAAAGPVNVAAVAESVVAMFRARCNSRGGEIRMAHHHDLTLPVPADDLRQILTNLISNACDALTGPAGLIEVDLRALNHRAVIEVRDTGAGIPAENLGRIFDPFFTTKEDVGTGIGLWVTRELVEKNAGQITVPVEDLPSPFQTSFRVEFPLA